MTVAPTPVGRRHRLPRAYITVALVAFVIGAIGAVLLIKHDSSQGSSSEIVGSGVPAVETRNLPGFSRVDLVGGNIVNVRVGGKQSVLVRADTNLIKRVTTHVVAGELNIGLLPGSVKAATPMRVDVTVPSLNALRLSGSGVISAVGIRAAALRVELPGSGVIRASGAVTTLDVSLSGSGDAQLETMNARSARADVSGSGRIVVTATKSLHASVSGSGVVMYGGNPANVTKNVTGSGAVVPG